MLPFQVYMAGYDSVFTLYINVTESPERLYEQNDCRRADNPIAVTFRFELPPDPMRKVMSD